MVEGGLLKALLEILSFATSHYAIAMQLFVLASKKNKKNYLEFFSEKVNLIKQKHYSKSINMIILKFNINIHNYQLNFYYNYNDNQLYI